MNKTIWMLWLQGWDNAPELVTNCLDSWKYYNPEWKIVLLDENTYKNYIDPLGIDTSKIGKDEHSDFVRTFLLEKYGGVWADATLFCNSPLDTWLFKNDFLFSDPLPGTMISNWFISKYDGIIVDVWAKYCRDFLNKVIKPGHQYANRWHHTLFKVMYNNEPEVKKHWDSYYKLSSNIQYSQGPHAFVPYEEHFNKPPTKKAKEQIINYEQPMYKLTHRYSYTPDSIVPFLFKTIKHYD